MGKSLGLDKVHLLYTHQGDCNGVGNGGIVGHTLTATEFNRDIGSNLSTFGGVEERFLTRKGGTLGSLEEQFAPIFVGDRLIEVFVDRGGAAMLTGIAVVRFSDHERTPAGPVDNIVVTLDLQTPEPSGGAPVVETALGVEELSTGKRSCTAGGDSKVGFLGGIDIILVPHINTGFDTMCHSL